MYRKNTERSKISLEKKLDDDEEQPTFPAPVLHNTPRPPWPRLPGSKTKSDILADFYLNFFRKSIQDLPGATADGSPVGPKEEVRREEGARKGAD